MPKRKKETRFVVHKHHARHLHYDLRLEREGALKSWAVPKGAPEEAGIRRLAVQVEDHPLDYIDFEGTIPEGQYGAGEVEVWDSGTYEIESWEKGKVVFRAYGKKLSGKYALLLMMERNWIFIKVKES